MLVDSMGSNRWNPPRFHSTILLVREGKRYTLVLGSGLGVLGF
jgi:hypothetical protein